MGLLSFRRTLLVLLLGMAPLAAVAAPVDRPPITVVVVLDNSGSMAQSDPRALAPFGLAVLASFLDDADRLGVVSMGRLPPESLAPQPVAALRAGLAPGGRQARQLEGWVQRRKGGSTPCLRSLQQALTLVQQGPPTPGGRYVVLFTDGECNDPAGPLLDLAGRLGGELGIPLFSLALRATPASSGTAESDALLQEMMRASGTPGSLLVVSSARDLPRAFATLSGLFRNTEARPVALALGQQPLPVDPYLRSLTLLATVEGGRVALGGLQRPDGGAPPAQAAELWEGRFPRAGAQFEGYSILKLRQPDPAGTWRLTVEAPAPPTAWAVFDYDLQAELQVGFAGEPAGAARLQAVATLRAGDGQPVAPAFLAEVTALLAHRPPGSSEWGPEVPMELRAGDAGFRRVLPATPPGVHELRVRLQRGKSLNLVAAARFQSSPLLRLAGPALPPCQHAGQPFVVQVEALLAGAATAGGDLFAGGEVLLWAREEAQPAGRPLGALRYDPGTRTYQGTFVLPDPGRFLLDVRGVVPDAPVAVSESLRVEVVRVHPRVQVLDAGPLQLAPGIAHPVSISLAGSELPFPLRLRLDRTASGLPASLALAGDVVELQAGAPLRLDLPLTPAPCGGEPGPFAGRWVLLAESGACLPATPLDGGPLTGTLAAAPLGARLGCFWAAHRVETIVGLVLLAILLYLLRTLIASQRVHRFDETWRIALGSRPDTLSLPIRIHHFRGTDPHFWIPFRVQHARAYWNPADASFAPTYAPSWYLEAGPGGQVLLFTPPQVEVARALSSSPSVFDLVEQRPVTLGAAEFYRITYSHRGETAPVYFEIG